MKLIYCMFFIWAFALLVFSQSGETLKQDLLKSELGGSDKNKVPPKTFLESPAITPKMLTRLYLNKDRTKVIPIPPAFLLNRKIELLPLHKPGDVVMKLIDKPKRK